MAQKKLQRGRGVASLPLLPPAGPAVTTQAIAGGPHEIDQDWIIVATRPNGKGEWQATMGYEDWRVFRAMVDDGTVSTAQRRDPAGTVLLARLRRAE